MKTFRSIRNIIVAVCIAAGTLLVITAGIAYFYRGKIMNLLVAEMNNYLAADVEVNKMELSMLEHFPYLSLSFSDVRIKEPEGFSNGHLAIAQTLYLAFNPLDLLQKKYEIEQIILERAVVNVTIDREGRGNYSILKTQDDTSSDVSMSFALKKIELRDVLVNFRYDPGMQYYSVLQKHAEARLSQQSDLLEIGLNGDLHIYDIVIAGQSYFREKPVSIRSKQTYSFKNKNLEIMPSDLIISNSGFHLAGSLNFMDKSLIDLSFQGDKGKIQTLISVLPASVTSHLASYQSEGNVYFNGSIKGELSSRNNPLITVDFGFENARIRNAEYKGEIRQANLTGSFTNGDGRKAETSELRISKFNAVFQDMPVKGYFVMTDFEDPLYEVSCNGTIDLASFIRFYPISTLEQASGTIHTDFYFMGRPDDLKKFPEKIITSGETKISNASFLFRDLAYRLNDFSGNLLFNRNDVAVNDFKGKINGSDFLLNGYFRNLIPRVLFDEEVLQVNASLKSSKLNINDFIITDSTSRMDNVSGEMPLKTQERLSVNLDLKIDSLIYNKLSVANMKAKLVLRQDAAILNDFSVKFGEGTLGGDIAYTMTEKPVVKMLVSADNIDVRKLFYVFDDFDQSFITQTNLRGTLGSSVDLIIPLDQENNVDYTGLVGKISLKISNGELIGFSPMQKLSLFVDERDLYNVRFSELTNELIVKDNSIYIPEMQISSNVSHITVYGTHTFDNYLDYKLTVPLKNFRKKDKDEAFGAIENDHRGNTLLHLTIKGPGDNFKVSYDTRRTGQKIREDLKKEKEEIGSLLKGKQVSEITKKEPALNDEEFFEF